jgi:Tetratricopeptide repeat/Cytochrome c554 and c-prime
LRRLPGLGALVAAILAFEVVNASYLAAFDSATIFYHAQVVAHLVAGILLAALVVIGGGPAYLRTLRAPGRLPPRALLVIAGLAAVVAIGTALRLAGTGTASPFRALLWTHIVASVFALAASAGFFILEGGGTRARRAGIALAAAILLPVAVRSYEWIRPAHVARIENPATPPLTPLEEGAGQESPFFPSSVTTADGRYVPEDFFLESKACGNNGCHPDITTQWTSSMHHFSSFNNQWYRKSIEYMQEVVGTKPSKWCGGCHDQSVLLTGRMDTPIVQQIDTPQAQAGIGCLVCHSIAHVRDTMGQGGYVLEYPQMHRLVASGNPVLHALHDYMVRLDPGPHKATMLKRFHRESRAEFCSACHKVHLDVPVNHYRWFRGFDEYDAWQGSGVSGQGARAFYYPEKPKDCGDCHMPLVASRDAGNRDGFVHSHRFPAANTAVPFANHDEAQLKATQDFLQANIVTVDIFAASEAEPAPVREGDATPAAGRRAPPVAAESAEPRAATMVPEMAEPPPAAIAGVAPAQPGALQAPLDRASRFMRAGGTYRVDVVARTRGVGHNFPGGTVDAFDVWLELKGEDAAGRVFFWSGRVEDDGRGPVEAGAHRYRTLLIDADGNPINKRNAWAARALVYARLIPPGAADVARFRVTVPPDARGPITFMARMNYRKFSWWNTQFSFAGVRDPALTGFALSPDADDGRWLFSGDTSHVSGAIKAIPDPPTTVVAQDRVTVDLLGRGAGASASAKPPTPRPQAFDRERFNDYGIGMFLQGDFVAARRAFETVNRIDPRYAAGFVNLGRVLVQEGDHAAALKVLAQALAIDPRLASGHYFIALALKARGQYDDALLHLRAAAAQYPRDKVVRDQIGRILFLKRSPHEAIAEFEQALAVDPEDLTAHYNLMLCYRALGEAGAEKREEALYTRFKADESAQTITGDYRRLNSEDNLERQPIHEHGDARVAARVVRAGATGR